VSIQHYCLLAGRLCSRSVLTCEAPAPTNVPACQCLCTWLNTPQAWVFLP
jgi:hypothetical protein